MTASPDYLLRGIRQLNSQIPKTTTTMAKKTPHHMIYSLQEQALSGTWAAIPTSVFHPEAAPHGTVRTAAHSILVPIHQKSTYIHNFYGKI